MSRLTRALVVGATVVALSLAPAAAAAQPHTPSQDTTSQQELAQRWNDYYQSTRVAPAELEAQRRAEATRRALAEKWNHYYHSTRIPPVELEAWERPADATEPPARATAPPRPDGSTEELGWLIIPLAVLAVLVVGLAVLAARFSGGPVRIRPAT
jgi:hypothetical protein